jgi:hypothetical protein
VTRILVSAALIITTLAQATQASAAILEDAASEAGVSPEDLRAALATQGLDDPYAYLRAVGELPMPERPVPAPNWQVACIKATESGGANVWNRSGSGAGGVMQYMPGTFARGAREMGHPEWSLWVPWQAEAVAAHDLAMGRRSQWTVSGC